MSEVKRIKTTLLTFPPEDIALRPRPKEDDSDFITLKKDIAGKGLLNLFTVCPAEDGTFMVVDGSRRAAACIALSNDGDARFDEINVQVREGDEFDAMERMIAGNATAKKTPSPKFVKQITKLLYHKGCTIEELAGNIGMSPQYVKDLLKLDKLPDYIKELWDNKDLKVTNLLTLNKLPSDEAKMEVLEQAVSLSGNEFATVVAEKLEDIAADKSAERKGKKPEFEVKEKYMKKDDAKVLLLRARQLHEDDPNDYNRGVLHALEVIFSVDEDSVSAQRTAWEKKRKEQDELKQKRAEERKEMKLKEAAKLIAEAKANGVTIEGLE